VSVTPHQQAVALATEADRVWFEQNAGREFRLRDPMALEFNGPLGAPGRGFTWRVLVARLKDGARLRFPVSLTVDLHNDGAKDGHLAILFEQVAPADAKAMRMAGGAKTS
jgi:hypothetical protein